ncbi:hypothetical protein CVT26_008659 [Gymnopilus dilepis]|uniref:Uncharacterized protein n=1 Tax=Gymnopilus dilepis TaxID=231916 RepID=A0A409XY36_9AGAR|nr:hypothetical protein CVT26_008659 [Gymnopilus dilepis]
MSGDTFVKVKVGGGTQWKFGAEKKPDVGPETHVVDGQSAPAPPQGLDDDPALTTTVFCPPFTCTV